ncbi:hypothetical protein NW762_004130 [Fusarium torreyae]|uniref:Ankyrin repeat protein n=1 Tax=Fusarium torreyae TaxID=1237075 RepID=A0A9W8VJZ3_9HYPO|nr:hypothetical protein NW762_004130 [Fusarium torreyae]
MQMGIVQFFWAIDKSNEAVVKGLLQTPSLIHVRDWEQGLPLHRCRDHKILGLTLDAIEQKRLRPSSTYGPGAFLINIDSTDVYGRTALLTMCEQCHLEMMKQLLKAGAGVNKSDKIGKSPILVCLLSNAERAKKEEMVLRLLEKHADPDQQDIHCNTAGSQLRRGFSSEVTAERFFEQDPTAALLEMERSSAPG